MLWNIESLWPQDRNIILVGHDIRHDLRALTALDSNIEVSSIIDTIRIANEVFSYWINLRRLLIWLGCELTGFHCGGNDVNFTLKACLLLATKDYAKHVQVQG